MPTTPTSRATSSPTRHEVNALDAAAPTFLRHAAPCAAHQHHLPGPPPRHATALSRAATPHDPCSQPTLLRATARRPRTPHHIRGRRPDVSSNRPRWGTSTEPTNLPPKWPKIATQPKAEPPPRPMVPPRASLSEDDASAHISRSGRCLGIHQPRRQKKAAQTAASWLSKATTPRRMRRNRHRRPPRETGAGDFSRRATHHGDGRRLRDNASKEGYDTKAPPLSAPTEVVQDFRMELLRTANTGGETRPDLGQQSAQNCRSMQQLAQRPCRSPPNSTL